MYTDYRPVPLRHFIFPEGDKGIHMVVDENVSADKSFLFVVRATSSALATHATLHLGAVYLVVHHWERWVEPHPPPSLKLEIQ